MDFLPENHKNFCCPRNSSEDFMPIRLKYTGMALIGGLIMATRTHAKTLSTFLGTLRAECDGSLEPEEWLSPQKICQELGVHLNSVYRWIKSGELTAYDLGAGKTYYRIKRSDLEEWLEKRSNQILEA